MLARYDIACDSEQALHIKMGGLRGQRPATRAKYRKAIEACERMEHLEKNLSEFAGRFGVDGSDKEKLEDFEGVRGAFESNPFVTAVKEHIVVKRALGEELIGRISPLL